jgi:hypothetical protein
MPGWDVSSVEHPLPIKPRFKPYKQSLRMALDVIKHVKEDIKQILEAEFIRLI